MSESIPEESITRADAQTLRRHRHAALELPEPGADWALAETPLDRQQLQTLSQLGAVAHADWEPVEPDREYSGGNYQRRRWETDPTHYEWIQHHLTDAEECPADGCHATGISNPADAAGYRCNNEACDERLTEAEARRLIE
jgi:hypothetical protein